MSRILRSAFCAGLLIADIGLILTALDQVPAGVGPRLLVAGLLAALQPVVVGVMRLIWGDR